MNSHDSEFISRKTPKYDGQSLGPHPRLFSQREKGEIPLSREFVSSGPWDVVLLRSSAIADNPRGPAVKGDRFQSVFGSSG